MSTSVKFSNKASSKTEVLIVRNSLFRTKYDVVEVNFLKESVKVIEAGLDFEAAVELQEFLKPEDQRKAETESELEEALV